MNRYLNLKDHPALLNLVRATGSRKLKAGITVTDKPLECWGYWDDGSRDQWHGPVEGTFRQIPASTNPPQFGGKAYLAAPTVDVPLIRTGVFCGKPSTPHIYVHPDSPLAKLAVPE